jgi:hypothetical protein
MYACIVKMGADFSKECAGEGIGHLLFAIRSHHLLWRRLVLPCSMFPRQIFARHTVPVEVVRIAQVPRAAIFVVPTNVPVMRGQRTGRRAHDGGTLRGLGCLQTLKEAAKTMYEARIWKEVRQR